ncbi:MAG: hypothetical protein U1F16_11870 [Turneriella sp.]
MGEKKQHSIRTSVSLPVSICEFFRKNRHALKKILEGGFRAEMCDAIRRNRTRCYNRTSENFVIVQVFWNYDVYNKLHAMAAVQRVSVSLLIYRLLMAMQKNLTAKDNRVSNYVLIVRSLSADCLHIEEKIIFQRLPPPNNSEEPPLAA